MLAARPCRLRRCCVFGWRKRAAHLSRLDSSANEPIARKSYQDFAHLTAFPVRGGVEPVMLEHLKTFSATAVMTSETVF